MKKLAFFSMPALVLALAVGFQLSFGTAKAQQQGGHGGECSACMQQAVQAYQQCKGNATTRSAKDTCKQEFRSNKQSCRASHSDCDNTNDNGDDSDSR